MIIITIVGAFLLDTLLGEPRKYHLLVGFGKIANYIEKKLNNGSIQSNDQTLKHHSTSPSKQLLLGSFATVILTLPFVLLLEWLIQLTPSLLTVLINSIVLYWAIGHQSLREHALRVLKPCLAGNLIASQQNLAMIVSRNTEQLDQEQVVQATVETVLENGSDAVFAPLFWFFLMEVTLGLGAMAVLTYRLSNTLDAMWGYRNTRFNYYGRFVARLDDVLNYFPARLTALSYALLGNTRLALQCWSKQSPLLKSPNAGPVMTAGAGSLNIRLGGPSYYHNVYTEKPYFGSDVAVKPADIERSIQLVAYTIILWCSTLAALTIVAMVF